MSALRAEAQVVHTLAGDVLCLAFDGVYPPGSQGNPTAEEIREFAEQSLAAQPSTFLIFDFSNLDYEWGDGLLSTFIRYALEERQGAPRREIAVVARGKTMNGMHSLFKRSGFLRLKPLILRESREEAMAAMQQKERE